MNVEFVGWSLLPLASAETLRLCAVCLTPLRRGDCIIMFPANQVVIFPFATLNDYWHFSMLNVVVKCYRFLYQNILFCSRVYLEMLNLSLVTPAPPPPSEKKIVMIKNARLENRVKLFYERGCRCIFLAIVVQYLFHVISIQAS